MGVGDPLPPDKNRWENKPPDIASTSSSFPSVVSIVNARLSDSPILLFVYFHKAFRAQLAELQRLAGDEVRDGSHLAVELRRKFDFLKLVYMYHSAAEDEVIFSALDTRVNNIVLNYSLEHESTHDLFTSIYKWLHVLDEEKENRANVLREVVLCIGTIQSSICQHMLKEERQVFPLLIENFSFEEQASLVWQFICSVPVMIVEELLPWMTSLLSPKEKCEVENCVREVVPKKLSLQPVVNSWLVDGTKIMNNSSHQTDLPSGLFQRFWRWSKMSFSSSNAGHTLVYDGIKLWHNAVKRDLFDIQKGLCQLKSPSHSLDLNVLVARLNFLVDVLIFYGNAFKTFFYPVFEEMVVNQQHTSASKQFTLDGHVENFKRSLDLETRTRSDRFVISLQKKLDSLILILTKQFSVEETEVFPIISMNCNIEMQKQLLYMSLHVLPLGLLKCVIMWFYSQLSEEESQSIIEFLSWEDSSFPNKPFAHLLLHWFRFSYSGKTSLESFWDELSFMFKPRRPVEEEHTEVDSGSLCKGSDPYFLVSIDLPYSSYMKETPYSSAMNQQVLIPVKLKPLQQLPGLSNDKNIGDDPLLMDLKPIDLLFFFHKAMQKDLVYLVCGSARLASDCSFLGEFQQRFHLVKFLYQIYLDAEDEIAFPALEAKGKLQNISKSYSIDHELEVEHLDKVSFLLSEMVELNMLASTMINSNGLDHYMKLCMSLQDVCKSIHNLFSEHLHREETKLWYLFRNCFTTEEQEKIIACMLGRMSGEILQHMIPWLMESLIPDEQRAVMSLWRQATRKTMFGEWLAEWYTNHVVGEKETGEANKDSFEDSDPLDIVWKYLFEGSEPLEVLEKDSKGTTMNKLLGKDAPNNNKAEEKEKKHKEISEAKKVCTGGADERRHTEQTDSNCQMGNSAQAFQISQRSSQYGQDIKYEYLLSMSQEGVEATLRRISRDSDLDPQKKSYIMQNFLMSRWIATQRIHNLESSTPANDREVVPGQHQSYRDPHKNILGCKHYKRSCKLLAPCCNQLFTCIRCHDEEVDHLMDRKQITKMMCMKCMIIQPLVKALPCGHVMHSTCFQEYTCSHYTCPICSKSLGDMQVYFRMLDALLAEQKMPDEYLNQTQVILCNDCGRKGNAPYHWLYHKCSSCASYNTRLL
ncbi:hypothetical protein Bca4012_062034 [Brassica carinata]